MKKEMIKAIRMVYGVNPDLRKRLAGINKECLMNWIDENKIGIFGISVLEEFEMDPAKEGYDEWERFLRMAANDVISGTVR